MKGMAETNTDTRGRVWFVTGASSGFGRSISQAVLDHGDRLAATSRFIESIESFADADRNVLLPLRLDVTDPEAVRKAVDEAATHFGRLDVVVNNAGFGYVGAVEELGDEDLRQQLDVNLYGVINVTRAALPQMRKQRSGHLVQMSSLNGIEGLAGAAYYTASKFAIEGFSESLADEVAHLGIKVTIVEPGPHRTHFLGERSAKWAEPMEDYAASVGQTRELLSQLDGNQPGDPERAARAIIRAVEDAEPPLRLPLGRMALDHIREKLEKQLADLNTWAELSVASDFPDK
jgi:NAD(P)-dependent dehydrogenase (short-subunit alcohol dehydrogenase family)